MFLASSPSRTAPIIPPLIARHGGDAAFYWSQHDQSAHSPLVGLAQLRHFERLLTAHMDGLQVAEEEGWRVALAALERWRGPAEVYVCGRLALESDRDGERLQALWPHLARDPDSLLRGLISALAWVEPERSLPYLEHWLSAGAPLALQIAAWRAAALLEEAGEAALAVPLAEGLAAPDPRLRAAACRVARKRGDLAAVPALLEDGNRDVRAEAAIALAGYHDSDRLAGVLWQALTPLINEREGLTGWFRSRAEHRLVRWVRHLGLMAPLGHPGVGPLLEALPVRLGLVFVLHHGDAAYLPWVAGQLDNPQAARFAGWVWSVLTGIDLESGGLTLPPRALEADEEPRPTDNLDAGLPEPHTRAIAHQRPELPRGVPLLLGQPLSRERLPDLLAQAPQALRWIAAQRLAGSGARFDTRAPVLRQARALAALGEDPAPRSTPPARLTADPVKHPPRSPVAARPRKPPQ